MKYVEEEQWVKHLVHIYCSFDYFDETLPILSATSGSVSIASFAIGTGAPFEITRASLDIVFSISNEIVKNLLKAMRKKKKKIWENCFIS